MKHGRKRRGRSFNERLGGKPKNISRLMLTASAALFAVAVVLLVRYIVMTNNTKATQQELKESYIQYENADKENADKNEAQTNLSANEALAQVMPSVSYAPQNYEMEQPLSTQEPAMAPEFLNLYKKTAMSLRGLNLKALKK